MFLKLDESVKKRKEEKKKLFINKQFFPNASRLERNSPRTEKGTVATGNILN